MSSITPNDALRDFLLLIPFNKKDPTWRTLDSTELYKLAQTEHFQSKFLVFCDTVSSLIRRRPFFDSLPKEAASHLGKIFLYCIGSVFPGKSHDTTVYLLTRSCDIVSMLMRFRIQLFHSDSAKNVSSAFQDSYFAALGYHKITCFYTLISLFVDEHSRDVDVPACCLRIGSDACQAAQASLLALSQFNVKTTVGACTKEEEVEQLIEKVSGSIKMAVDGCMGMVDRGCMTTLGARRLAVAYFRCSGCTTGRFYVSSSVAGCYEDHTAHNFHAQLMQLGEIIMNGIFGSVCLLAVSPAILMQFCDSVMLHIEAVSMAIPGCATLEDQFVMYPAHPKMAQLPRAIYLDVDPAEAGRLRGALQIGGVLGSNSSAPPGSFASAAVTPVVQQVVATVQQVPPNYGDIFFA